MTSSYAADMPVKAPMAPAAVSNWSGCYGGIQGSYGLGHTTPYDPVLATNWSNEISFDGFMGGATLGCNYQVNSWVFGIEGDWSWGSIKGRENDLLNPAFFDVQVKERSLGTLRARIGYAINNNALLYATGGGAWSDVKFSFPCIAACNNFSATKTVSGYTIGAGLEYAFARNWSVKGEWLYVDFGKPRFNARDEVLGTLTDPADVRLRQNIFRLGLNYRFWSY
jgi:outer membrane immunogenic protein